MNSFPDNTLRTNVVISGRLLSDVHLLAQAELYKNLTAGDE